MTDTPMHSRRSSDRAEYINEAQSKQIANLAEHVDRLYDADRETKTALAQLTTSMNALVDRVGSLSDDFKRTNDRDWVPIASVGLTAMAMVAALFWAFISPLESSIGSLSAEMKQRTSLVYEAPLKTARNKADIDKLDTMLQREMRLLDDATDERVVALDAMLQREMRLLNQRQDEIVQRNREDLMAMAEWQRDHDQRVVGMNAAQNARLDAIEREMIWKNKEPK